MKISIATDALAFVSLRLNGDTIAIYDRLATPVSFPCADSCQGCPNRENDRVIKKNEHQFHHVAKHAYTKQLDNSSRHAYDT